MKRKLLLMILAALILLAGCDSGLEERVAALEGQVAALEARVDALEAENAPPAAPESAGDSDPIAELNLYDWSFEGDTLTVNGAFARVMQLANSDGTISQIGESRVVLYRNGTELYHETFQLLPGEASDSYELELEFFGFHLPDLAEGDALELQLEITLSDGRSLTAWGGSWDYADGSLLMIAG